MFSLLLRCEPGEEDLLTAELWEQGTSGVTEEPGGCRAFFDDDARAPDLLNRFRRYGPELRAEPETDWEQVVRDSWPPMLVGRRFCLVPPWHHEAVPAGRLRLEFHPGMACGSGWHAATQLCLEALENRVQPGSVVVDVGAGSGILSAAALLLGGAPVIACDIDADAIEIACARVAAQFYVGSIDAVRSGVADVIVANISAEAIESLRPEFERVRRHDGALILSGFPEWDAPRGYTPREILRREEWLCYVC